MSKEMDRLPPERRYRLYNRIAEVFREKNMPEAEESARALARQALQESPELQKALGEILNAMRDEQ